MQAAISHGSFVLTREMNCNSLGARMRFEGKEF